ncbi:unnamed protein product, partial [Mesorhabditis spiculigera]
MVATSVSPKRISPVKGDEIEQLAPLKPPQVPVLPPEIASHPLIESPPRKDFLPTAAYSNGYEQQPEISLPVREPSPEEESDADSEMLVRDEPQRRVHDLVRQVRRVAAHEMCRHPHRQAPKNYLCEQCNPRKMKLTKGQAKDYQQKKLAELTKEKQRKKDRREKRRARS